MQKRLVPDPLYEHVRDHLEQALAIVPAGPRTDELRACIDEALETALELAYRRRDRSVPLYVVSTDRH